MSSLLKKYPWLFVIFAFLLLLGAWSSLIVIASKHRPQSIDPSFSDKGLPHP